MIKGKIININSTKYIVDTDMGTFDTVLRGVFRKERITPLVGDYVEIDEKLKRIDKIFERKNYLTRPNIANVDLALVITSVKKPDLDLNLLDKLLVNIIASGIKPFIIFTKMDLLNDEEISKISKLKDYYNNIGIQTIFKDEIDLFKKIVSKKICVCCGQTGAGKSSFINLIDKTKNLETKPISESLNRGVHTTRYVSLYKIDDYYIADTPGFSALDLSNLEEEDIRFAFLEFSNYDCKYRDCNHISTDGCEVINQVGLKILESRYENYQKFVKEIHENSSKLFKK